MKLSGIYCIEDGNGFLYYGSAKDINRRWASHKNQLNKNRHGNKKLQRAWNKHGKDYFSFYVVEVVLDQSKLIAREQVWLDSVFSSDKFCYNICKIAGSTMGKKHSPDAVEKMRKANIGRKATDAQKDAMRIRMKGNKYAVGNKGFAGKTLSDDAKAAIGNANRGNTIWRGRTHKEESKLKIAESRIGKKLSTETKEKKALIASGGKIYSFIGPDGAVYTDIVNLAEFAKQHDLDQGNLRRVTTGEYKQHKGFRLLSVEYLEEYKIDKTS